MGIGIFPGQTAVTAVHLKTGTRRPRLRAIVETPLAGGSDLAAVLRGHGLPAGPLALALPTRSVTVRKTTVPLTQPGQLRRTMRFQAEKLIPGLAPEDAVVDYYVTRQGKEHTELLLVVARKADIRACLARAGLNGNVPKTITAEFAALFNLLAQGKAFDGAAQAVVVDTSGEGVCLLHVEAGILQAVRMLAAGPADQACERIAREIAYTLAAAAGAPARPDRVILAGPARDGIDQARLAAALGCEAVTFDPCAHIRAPGPAAPALPSALAGLGAALDTLGPTALPLNLAREDARYETSYERLRKPIFLCATALLVLLAAALIRETMASGDGERRLEALQKHAKVLYSQVVPSGKPKFSSAFHKDIEKIARQKAAAGTAGQEWLSFLDFMKVLSEHLPAGRDAVIQSVAFRGQKVMIRGEARDTEAFEALARGLEKAGRFDVRTPFRMRSGRPNAPARLAFAIELSPRIK